MKGILNSDQEVYDTCWQFFFSSPPQQVLTAMETLFEAVMTSSLDYDHKERQKLFFFYKGIVQFMRNTLELHATLKQGTEEYTDKMIDNARVYYDGNSLVDVDDWLTEMLDQYVCSDSLGDKNDRVTIVYTVKDLKALHSKLKKLLKC